MIKPNRIKNTVILVIFLSLLSCSDKPKNKIEQNNPILQSYRLIDSGRTDEAILLLESSIKKDPQNRKLKFTLISAYAHKAGFKAQNLTDLLTSAQQFKELNKKINTQQNITYSSSLNERLDANLLKLTKMFIYISRALEIFRKIPNVDYQHLAYLQHAISLFDGLYPLNPTESMYRAILNTLFFKHIVFNQVLNQSHHSIRENNTNKCKIHIPTLNQSLIQAGDTLIEVLLDFSVAQPNEVKSVQSSIDKISRTVTEITLITETLLVFDISIYVYSNNEPIQSEINNFLKCQ